MSGISVWQLLIILLIVLALFGTKRLRNLGGDLGAAIKGFRSAMKDGEKPAEENEPERGRIIEGQANRDDLNQQTTAKDGSKT